MKYPIMPFWVGDFLIDTMELTDTAVGVYVKLLIHQWNNGTIPADVDRLALIAPAAPLMWEQLEKYFHPVKKQPGRLMNNRCQKEKEKTEHRSRVAKKNADARWNADDKQD